MLRVYSILIIVLFSTKGLVGQQKDIRLNFGLHGNIPERLFNSQLAPYNQKNEGMGVHICPVWYYSPRISFGLNGEYSFVAENYQSDAIGGFDILSLTPTVNYYFTEKSIRPFAGLGLGLYHVIDHQPTLNPGIRPMAGVSFYKRFNLSIEYNKILTPIQVNSLSHGAFDNYYLAIKGSFSIGLGHSKKNK